MGTGATSLDRLSGPWSGLWFQRQEQGRESLDLVFQDSHVLGIGTDRDGEFQYAGTYGPKDTVCLGKVYTRPNRGVPARMTYLGRWNGRSIQGRWSDDRYPDNAGPFRLWPGTGPDPGEGLEAEADLEEEPSLAVVEVHRQTGPTGSPTTGNRPRAG